MQVGQRRYAKSYRSRRCQEFGLRASTTHVTALDNYLGIRLVEEFYFTDFYRILDRPLTTPPLIPDRPAMRKSDSQSPHYLSAARACPCVAFPLIVNQRYPSCRYLTYSSPTFAQIIRIISNEDITPLTEALKIRHQGITIVDGHGAVGPVKLIFTIVKRTDKADVIELINTHASNAFYSIEDVKGSEHGVFTDDGKTSAVGRLFSIRKGK